MEPVKLAVLACFLVVFGGCIQQAADNGIPGIESVFVSRAIDGDTLVLENGERARLIGIDAPEKGEKCFEEARERLDGLVAGRKVLLERDASERDKYGRLVRYVYLDGRLVNLAMVEEGLAFAFRFEPDTRFAGLFKDAESKAVDGNGCLWLNR